MPKSLFCEVWGSESSIHVFIASVLTFELSLETKICSFSLLKLYC